MEMYHFLTKWFFNAPIEKLWKEIEDLDSWPTWSEGFKKVKIRGPELTAQLGTVADAEVKGSLPYTLHFKLEVTTIQPPTLMEFKSAGDLAGTGKWVLEPRDNGTAVTYFWDVGTTNPIFNLAGKLPFVRKMMEKNHDEVMKSAYQGLKNKVKG
jgi:carbon monoxide dehydrogenase subunit G